MKKGTACFMHQICSADLYYWTETNNSSTAAKMGDQYKSMWQNIFTIFSLKDSFFFVAVLYVKVAELITQWGDAKHKECLCLVLKRHSAALWLREHILYFWYDLCLLQHKGLADLGRNWALEKKTALHHLPAMSLVWLSWQEQQVSGRQDREMFCWRNRCSLPCLGNSRAHSNFSVCHSLCVVFFAVDRICGSAEHTYLEGKSVGATHWISKRL